MIEIERNGGWSFWGLLVLGGLAFLSILAACAGNEAGRDPNPTLVASATASTVLSRSTSTEITPEPSVTSFLRPTSFAVPTVEDLPAAIANVVTHVAAERKLMEDDIVVLLFESQTWSSTALGCPDPGRSYAQIVTQGFEVLLSVPGELLTYHVDLGGSSLTHCER